MFERRKEERRERKKKEGRKEKKRRKTKKRKKARKKGRKREGKKERKRTRERNLPPADQLVHPQMSTSAKPGPGQTQDLGIPSKSPVFEPHLLSRVQLQEAGLEAE